MKWNQGQKGQFQYLGLKVKNDLKNEIFNRYNMYALQYIKSGITFCIYFTLLSLNSKIVLALDFGLDFVSRLKSEKMNKRSLLCVIYTLFYVKNRVILLIWGCKQWNIDKGQKIGLFLQGPNSRIFPITFLASHISLEVQGTFRFPRKFQKS